MEWILDKGRAICPQICEQVCKRIVTGEFKPGEKLLSVRVVAVKAGVNPNTVQKSFDILEQKGILFSQRGLGWFVSENIALAKSELATITRTITQDYFSKMKTLGMSPDEVKQYVLQWNES
ncbi:MAG: GntR family transcriptional regulator [Clostridia bacterium]|nr:GntR family transcriptional regulator [Clostridia bacterium]